MFAILGFATALQVAGSPVDSVIDQATSIVNSRQDRRSVDRLEEAVTANPNCVGRHLWLGNARGGGARQLGSFEMSSLIRGSRDEFEPALGLDTSCIDARISPMAWRIMASTFMVGGVVKGRGETVEIGKRGELPEHRALAADAVKDTDMTTARAGHAAAVRENPCSPPQQACCKRRFTPAKRDYRRAVEELDAAAADAEGKQGPKKVGLRTGPTKLGGRWLRIMKS